MPALIRSLRVLCRAVPCAGALVLGLAALAEAYSGGTPPFRVTRGGGEIMTNEKVISLSKAGVPEDIIMDMVESASRSQFDMTERGVLQLQAANVSPDVIRTMRKIYKEEIKKHDRMIRNMIQILRSDDAEHYERAVRVLARYGAYAVPLLLDHLADEDERIRAGVCEILGRIGDPPSVEPLLKALSDRNRAVRARAAEAVSLFDKSLILPRIEKALGRRTGPRDGYALTLGYIGDPKHQGTLIEITDDPGPESDRAAAAYALGLLGEASPEAVRVLIEAALNDAYRELREAATRALGRLGEKTEPRLKLEVGHALAKAMQRYRPSRAVIARQLRFFPGRRTVETLLAYLADRDRDVSTASWESLKAATGEMMPQDAEKWRSWWELAQLQPRWQGERFLPAPGGEEVEEVGAAPEIELEEPGEAAAAAAAPPPAPEDPFVR